MDRTETLDYLVYDVEIAKLIPSKKEPQLPGYEYCADFRDFENMGLSVVGCYLSRDNRYFHFDASVDDFSLLEDLEKFKGVLVGFNSKSFDDWVLAASGIMVQTNYDLLEEIRLAAFGSIRWQDTPKGFNYSLGRIGMANGFPKTGSGELAPKLWQDGERDSVIQYCLRDVEITNKLLQLGLKGELVDPNTCKFLQLRSFEEVLGNG